jgi:hypothetical protein
MTQDLMPIVDDVDAEVSAKSLEVTWDVNGKIPPEGILLFSLFLPREDGTSLQLGLKFIDGNVNAFAFDHRTATQRNLESTNDTVGVNERQVFVQFPVGWVQEFTGQVNGRSVITENGIDRDRTFSVPIQF